MSAAPPARRSVIVATAQAPDEKETRAWLAPFAPWRALLAAHLWASLALPA